jgi:hypothetical protein
VLEVRPLGRKWIVRVVAADGTPFHDGPWLTRWAAERSAALIGSGRYGPEPNRERSWRR